MMNRLRWVGIAVDVLSSAAQFTTRGLDLRHSHVRRFAQQKKSSAKLTATDV